MCGEFCGLSHSLMRTRVKALTPAEYEAWIAGQQAADSAPGRGQP